MALSLRITHIIREATNLRKKEGRPEEALEKLQTALDEGGLTKREKASLLVGMGDCHRVLRNPEQARAYFSQAVDTDGHYPHARNALARSLEAAGRHEEAIGHYQKVLTQDRRNHFALTRLQSLAPQLVEPEESSTPSAPATPVTPTDRVALLRQDIQNNPLEVGKRIMLARILIQRGETEEAASHLQHVLERDRENHQAKTLWKGIKPSAAPSQEPDRSTKGETPALSGEEKAAPVPAPVAGTPPPAKTTPEDVLAEAEQLRQERKPLAAAKMVTNYVAQHPDMAPKTFVRLVLDNRKSVLLLAQMNPKQKKTYLYTAENCVELALQQDREETERLLGIRLPVQKKSAANAPALPPAPLPKDLFLVDRYEFDLGRLGTIAIQTPQDWTPKQPVDKASPLFKILVCTNQPFGEEDASALPASGKKGKTRADGVERDEIKLFIQKHRVATVVVEWPTGESMDQARLSLHGAPAFPFPVVRVDKIEEIPQESVAERRAEETEAAVPSDSPSLRETFKDAASLIRRTAEMRREARAATPEEGRATLDAAFLMLRQYCPEASEDEKPQILREMGAWWLDNARLHQETSYRNARALFKEAAEANPDSAEIHAALVGVHLRLQETEDALRHYQKACALDPSLRDPGKWDRETVAAMAAQLSEQASTDCRRRGPRGPL